MYSLNGVTLPNPKAVDRSYIEQGASNVTIQGQTTKNVVNRREVFTLTFLYLSLTDGELLEFILAQNIVQTLIINDSQLQIGPIDVLVDVSNNELLGTKDGYKQNITLVLTQKH